MLRHVELVNRSRQSNSLWWFWCLRWTAAIFPMSYRSYYVVTKSCDAKLILQNHLGSKMNFHGFALSVFGIFSNGLSVQIWLLFWTLGTFGVRDPFSAAPCHDFLSNAHSRWLKTSWTSAESIWWVPTTSTNPRWFWKLLCNSYLSFPWHAFILSDVNLDQKTVKKTPRSLEAGGPAGIEWCTLQITWKN